MRPDSATSPRRSGFTLIEVAIALAIFVIGCLAIIRIFPGLLGVVQTSGERVAATNVNRAKLAVLENTPSLIPDATYDTSATWVGSTIGSVRRNNAVPSSLDTFDTSAYGHFKHIQGERHRKTADDFVLLQNAYNGTVGLFEEDTLLGVSASSAGSLDFTGAKFGSSLLTSPFTGTNPPATYQYIDGQSLNDTIFYITYQYKDTANKIWQVVDEPWVSKSATPSPLLAAAASSRGTILAGGVQVRFRHRLATPVVGTDDNFVGRVTLPAGLTEGQLYSFDYVAEDWRWLVADDVPGRDTINHNITTLLPIRYIDDGFEPYPLYGMTWEPGVLATANGKWPDGSPTAPITSVNYKSAEVSFNSGTAIKSPYTRVVYRTLDNWAQQVHVAPRSYILADTNYSLAEPWRYYTYSGGNLYFPPSEAGKTIHVSYTIQIGANPEVVVHDRLVVIDEDIIDTPGGVTGVDVGGKVSTVELTDIAGSSGTIRSITDVSGASVQVRTAWLNGARFGESSLMGYRRTN